MGASPGKSTRQYAQPRRGETHRPRMSVHTIVCRPAGVFPNILRIPTKSVLGYVLPTFRGSLREKWLLVEQEK